ncbi:MAG: tetratricopeptide repeat protein [bacterium]
MAENQGGLSFLDIIPALEAKISDAEENQDLKSLQQLINGKNTILDICDQSSMNDFETCNYLWALFNAGKISKQGVRSPHEILDDDDTKRMLSRGKAFYQKGRFADAVPFFERIIKIQPDNKEADRFLTRSITAIQNELLKALGSPMAVLEINKGFRLEEAKDLSAKEGFVLSRIDGKTAAKEITYISGLSQTESCITLNRLFERGIIRAGKDKEEVRRGKRQATTREILDPKKKQMTLDLADILLSEILLDLMKQRQTGILQLISAPMDIRVYLHEGSMVYATSNMESDRCGSIMLRKKKITEDQHQEVKTMADRENMLQGNALVKLGIITPNDLIWLTKTKVEEILISLFGWRNGKLRFFETELEGLDIIQLKLIPGRIIMEGTWRYFEEEEIMKVFKTWDILFDVVETPPLSRRELELTDTEVEILELAGRKKKIEELAAATGLQKLEVLKVVFGFYSLGLVMISSQVDEGRKEETARALTEMNQRWEEVRKQDYYTILDLDKGVDDREIKKAFFRFTKKYHPDRSYRYTDKEILDRMLNIFLAGRDAYEILSHPNTRKDYDNFLNEHGKGATPSDFQKFIKPNIEVSHIMKAEDLFNKGKTLLFSGRYVDASEFFEKALELVPDDPDYNAYTGLAFARMNKDYQQAVHLIEKALESNDKNADYHAFLGEAHLRSGKKKMAEESFAAALEVNPRHIQAKREYLRLRAQTK